jgi:hypothetical protein
VTVSGGMATVTFDFQATMNITPGNQEGTATLQYYSDQEPSWGDLPGGFSSFSSQTFGPDPKWATVYVNNLSTLHFRVFVSANAQDGGYVSVSATASNLSVSVSSGGPPPNATVFSNLQTIQDWKVCEGECVINGTNTGPPDNNGYIYYGISSPSLSGASLEQEDESINYPYFDVLYSLDEANELDQGLTLGCSSSPCPFNHFIDDLWFYIPQSSLGSIENLEFDPDYSDPNGNTYKMSMECTSTHNTDHPNHWQYWNSSTNQWVDTAQDCSSVWNNYGKWQHLTIQVAINSNNQYTYQTVSIGPQGSPQQNVTWANMTTPIPAGTTPPGWPMNVWVQQEIDNTSAGGTSIVYYDDYSLTAWYQ